MPSKPLPRLRRVRLRSVPARAGLRVNSARHCCTPVGIRSCAGLALVPTALVLHMEPEVAGAVLRVSRRTQANHGITSTSHDLHTIPLFAASLSTGERSNWAAPGRGADHNGIDEFDVSRDIAQRAVQILADEGKVIRFPGLGWYVAE